MPEIRKLLRLAPNAFAVTIPAKYRKALGLGYGNYVAIYLLSDKTIGIQKVGKPEIK